MARNVEIKARIASIEALLPRVRAMAGGPAELIAQDDTFFACTQGRLKLRVFAPGHGELIAYDRPDSMGPKTSNYHITPTADPDGLRSALTRTLGETGRVKKLRTLFFVGRTRVHLDSVEDLGDFLELEVVLRDDEAAELGVEEAHDLLRQLGVRQNQLVAVAYIDLLRARQNHDPRPAG